MYPNMTSYLPFYYDIKGFYQNDKSFMITGRNIAFLAAFLNSTLFRYCFSNNFPNLGEKGRELRKIFFDKIPVLQVSQSVNAHFSKLIEDIQANYSIEKAKSIDLQIFHLYNLTDEEIAVVEPQR